MSGSKATPRSRSSLRFAGELPTPELMVEMGKFMEEITKAGVLLSTEGLHPSTKGARVKLSGGKLTVTDGPFAETKEMISSYAIVEVASKAEAIEWATRWARLWGELECEVRQIFEESDLPAEFRQEGAAAR